MLIYQKISLEIYAIMALGQNINQKPSLKTSQELARWD